MSIPVPVRSGRFRHGRFELAYEVYGESGIPCVLTHGLLLDSLLNRDLALRFAGEGYQVALLDLLGHGLSEKPTDPREHRADFYGDQVLGLMDHLGFERALVGGISLGAMAALHAAVKAPQRCHGLFLEMPVMEWSTVFAAILLAPLITAVDYAKGLYRPVARLLRRLPRPRTAWLASGLNAASAEPEVITAILHGLLVGPVVPSAPQRRSLAMPALVIGHGRDKLHELRDAQSLAEEMQNARLLTARSILELRTRPDRLWPDIRDFLHSLREQVLGAAAAAPLLAAAPRAAGDNLRRRFDEAVESVRSAPPSGPIKPSNEMKLRMYALFRQANDGDVQGKRPSIVDPVGRFKYDAWAALKGTSREDAMRSYIEEVERLRQKYAAAG